MLCHDDELEGRRIAYIYYLVPKDWSKEDGGALDLFDVDGKSDLTFLLQFFVYLLLVGWLEVQYSVGVRFNVHRNIPVKISS